MMRVQDRKYAPLDTAKVVEYASYPEWHLDKAHALYELACRSLLDPTLLPAAWDLIGAEISFSPRQGPPLGQPAAARLLDSGLEGVEAAMVESMRKWTAEQQADFFIGLFQKTERRLIVDRLARVYSFEPKIFINQNGDVLSAQ